MHSETSEGMHKAQPLEEEVSEDTLKKADDFLAKLKDKMQQISTINEDMAVQSDSIQQVSGFVLVTPSSQSWSQPDKELKRVFFTRLELLDTWAH
ncbi:hypothetical protein H5410_004807 [Solanum commersonii]|uniref:Uncharacterized protein n=1 Tax=Solanum commersonii TaxID=4109 RepID=A0A9J6A4V1_SOLCO|nr:hypothetical protein H5410_004807 [Solanum commersonii]